MAAEAAAETTGSGISPEACGWLQARRKIQFGAAAADGGALEAVLSYYLENGDCFGKVGSMSSPGNPSAFDGLERRIAAALIAKYGQNLRVRADAVLVARQLLCDLARVGVHTQSKMKELVITYNSPYAHKANIAYNELEMYAAELEAACNPLTKSAAFGA